MQIFKKKHFFIIILLALTTQVGYSQRADRPTREEFRERFKQKPAPVIGVHGNYDFDAEDFGLGAHGQVPVLPRLSFAPGGDLYFGDETTWQMNADIMLGRRLLRPGGGLAIVDGSRVNSGDTEIGYNLFIVLQPMMIRRPDAPLRPFAEVRWTFANDERLFRLALGVSFPIN